MRGVGHTNQRRPARSPRACSRGEDCEAGEEPLLVLGEEVVAPRDRRLERALALGQIACAAREKQQSLAEALENVSQGEHLDPHGREFERKRKVVETAADLGDRIISLKVGLDRP